MRDVYFLYGADIVSRCAKIYPQWFTFSFVRKNKHTDKQRNKHTFKTKEKQTNRNRNKTRNNVKIFSWSDSFSRGNKKQKKQKIKDKLKDKR